MKIKDVNISKLTSKHYVPLKKYFEENESIQGKIVVIQLKNLKEKYRNWKNQLFYAEDGHGCIWNNYGTKVYGKYLIDGEQGCIDNFDLIGVLRDDMYSKFIEQNENKIAK